MGKVSVLARLIWVADETACDLGPNKLCKIHTIVKSIFRDGVWFVLEPQYGG